MTDLSVRPISSEAEEQAFLRMPWTVYRDDPNWVPPLWREHVRFFDPQYNVELKHMDMVKMVAWRGDRPVGTIIPFINHAYNDYQETNAAWFGQFELLNDREAGHALLAAAEAFAREKGAAELIGPGTYGTNSEIGMLIDGFDTPPMIMMPHGRPYYQEILTSYGGFEQAMDLYAYHFDGNEWGGRKADNLPEKLTRIVKKLEQRQRFTLREVNMRRLDEEAELVKKVYNSAWSKNWGFVPMNDEEIEHTVADLKDILDPKVAVIAEVDGEAVGFGLPLPNIYEPLRKVQCKPGQPYWWQLLKLLWYWKVIGVHGIRAWGMGVIEEYRNSGIDAAMYYHMIKNGIQRGYLDIEMSWILANNEMMNRGVEMMGAEIYKTYRVYRKAL
jgi:hypothetical protein